LSLTFVLALAGTIVGDLIWYEIGRIGGQPVPQAPLPAFDRAGHLRQDRHRDSSGITAPARS
jgi:membrane protein DedA with SNARE-associated domain